MSRLSNEYLKRTPFGEIVRYTHNECGDHRDSLTVKRDVRGWVFKCFHCGLKGAVHKNSTSPTETLMIFEPEMTTTNNALLIPADLTTQIPGKFLLWLHKYEIQICEAIDHYQFRYSPSMDRLIMPIIGKNGEWIFWQGRTLNPVTKDNPKYKSASVRGTNPVFESNRENPTAVLVEDILSAIRVSECAHAIAILGSYISDDLIHKLRDKKRIVVWLDHNKRLDALKFALRIQSMTGVKTSVTVTIKDPKEYSDERIQECVHVDNGTSDPEMVHGKAA